MSAAAVLRSACALVLLIAPRAEAQDLLPAGPVQVLDGQLVVSGEVLVTAGERDDLAFFNYTDYEHNMLRMLRVAISGAWRPADRLAFVGEVRSENFDGLRPYAAYLRVRPWIGRRFDVQVGRIPPVFGAFGRRAYAADNPVIGYPLGYQYLTSLRSDAVPNTTDDLLRMRGRGWQSAFPAGNPTPAPGLPLVTAFRWDTGVQAHWESDHLSIAGAITAGTLSNPRLDDDNGSRQLAVRAGARPAPGLVAGVSAARGGWLAEDVRALLSGTAASRDHAQQALGIDLEYSRGYWLVRGEAIWSRWNLPLASNGATLDLGARAVFVEGRYRVRPRVFVAARVDDLGFTQVTGTLFGGRPVTWDAPVRRVEVGGGYYLQRNLTAHVSVQRNWRDGGRVRNRTFISAQLAYWF